MYPMSNTKKSTFFDKNNRAANHHEKYAAIENFDFQNHVKSVAIGWTERAIN